MFNRKQRTGLFFGLSTFDTVFDVSRLPGVDEKIVAEGFRSFAGGPALNAAITYSILGGDAHLVSFFDDTPFAQIALAELEEYEVRVVRSSASQQFRFPVASVMISRPAGLRSVVSSSRPNKDNTFESDFVEKTIGNARPLFVMTDGHYLSEESAAALRHSSTPIFLDAGSWKDSLPSIFCEQAIVVAGKAFQPKDGLSPFEYAKARGVGRFATTAGDGPIRGYDEDGEFAINPPSVAAIDTLGAGDIFHGAFAWFHFSEGRVFRESLAQAARVAATRVQFVGPREGVVRAAQAKA